jgi:hypothetical protein
MTNSLPKLFYVLVVDVNRTDLNLPAFHHYLQEGLWITKWAWYQSIPGVYFLQSPLLLKNLRERIDLFLQRDFILISTSADLMDGRLTTNAWDWLSKEAGLSPKFRELPAPEIK